MFMELKLSTFNVCLTILHSPLSPEWFLILLFRFLSIGNDVKIIIPKWFLRLYILATFNFPPHFLHSFRTYRAEFARNTLGLFFFLKVIWLWLFLNMVWNWYRFCFSKSFPLNIITGLTTPSTHPSNPQAALMWEL